MSIYAWLALSRDYTAAHGELNMYHMFLKEWHVVVVDDERDVLSISQLALKRFNVYGLPLHTHIATSKAEAIEILEKLSWSQHSVIAVAFIDVVMESENAGLELCEYIRDTMGNKIMQLYVRTGQAGVAPERAVMGKYDISGYFTKTEMTEDKLYTLVTSGVREVLYRGTARLLYDTTNALIAASSQEDMAQVMNSYITGFQQTASGEKQDALDVQLGIVVDGSLVVGDALDDVVALDSEVGKDLGGGD
jgi:CheY-like chemotaxis protein